MHWVKNPSAIDLDSLFQPRIPDSCILEPEIVASLFKTGLERMPETPIFQPCVHRSRSLNASLLSQTLFHSARSKPSAYSKPTRMRARQALPTKLTPNPNSNRSSRSPVLLWAAASALVMPDGRCSVNFLCFNTNGYPPRQPHHSRNTCVQ
jgi:hypothetical protein